MARSSRPRITLRDVAREAGVGEATAARALGGYGSVSEASRQRISDVARRLGYTRNAVARALASGSTQTVGLVVGDIENPFFATAARAMGDVLEAAGFTLLLANSDESREGERRVVATLLEHRIDGMAVAPSASVHLEHLTELVASGVPLVLIDRPVEGLDVDTVMVDNVEAADRAVSHLIEQGYQRVAVVADSLDIVTSQERVEGARRAVERAGRRLGDDQVIVAGLTPQHSHRAILGLLENHGRVDALFTISNFMTQGAVTALRQAGVAVPDEIGLVGFDDPDWASFIDPPVTVVVQPTRRVGELTAQRLLCRVEGDSTAPRTFRLECDFVVRRSSLRGRRRGHRG